MIKKANCPIKNGKSSTFSQENIQHAYKHTKRCSISLAIRKMQSNATKSKSMQKL
jgi:hypothetical protein